MPKLKILHTTTRLVRGGGVENNIFHTIDLLQNEYDFILSCGADMQENPFESNDRVKVIVCNDLVNKIHPVKDFKALVFYYRMIKKENVDVIHTHETKASFITKFAAWLAHCPYIIYGLHGVTFNDPMSRLKRSFYIFLEKITIGVSDLIVAVSNDVIKHYHQNNIGKSIPYAVVRSGIDLEKFFAGANICAEEKDKLKERMRIGQQTKVIINVGRFSFAKGQRYVLQCFARLKKDFPDSKLIFIGEGDTIAACRELAIKLKINQDVIFEGYKKNIPVYLSLSDLFLFTSLREGLPRVIVEAALMKVPVAAFEVEGIREVINHNQSGIIVSQYDVTALYEGAKHILSSDEVADMYAEKAFNHVQHEWDIKKMAVDLRRVYSEVENKIKK